MPKLEVKVLKRSMEQVTIPKKRKKRKIANFAYNSIPLQSGATENCLLHKHMSGYVLIELNANNEPVRAWRDIDGIFPVRSCKIETERIAHIVERVKPKTLFMNDGEPLAKLLACTDIRVEPYSGSLLDVLSSIIIRGGFVRKEQANVSFQDAQLLDPNMTYSEYCFIYDQMVENRPSLKQ